ncbi:MULTISPECIES: Rieske 2Fe-2S domain-containing protein [Micromonospora]|uniref:Phenylpropionate dioxygenase, large terminal subunit n=1 Tax=Micromonospora yangpuensis TaxID=683228 RepID=A0A1C6UU54_9ACTN|nr:Rieske 2Fe-2S domain-containing protein [Micromonospora yangpuensis]GGM24219.1 hypothetical protein GCM10012279_48240 [Micromonospora yangpuensis]SCL57614.1 Phenylpropionate dioxygenase, large terminal subunit [Micromonospora yangpuensis]
MSRTENPTEPRRSLLPPPPAEGADGLYSQTWFPVCLSADLAAGRPLGSDLLGGRVVAFRGAGGTARVVSAYCVHVGADLSVGSVVDGQLRCRFHQWTYDEQGVCTATGIGDPVPAGARLFSFPTVERYGVVWAFNGVEPLFELPELRCAQEDLVLRTMAFPHALDSDPWVITAQTMDLQHFSQQHDFELLQEPGSTLSATPYSIGWQLKGRTRDGEIYDARTEIVGNNIYWQNGEIDGRWFFWVTGISVVRPQRCTSVFAYGTDRQPGEDDQAAQQFLDRAAGMMMALLEDDAPVLQSIHFRPGLLTESDGALDQFIDYLRKFPRANPSADFIV